MAGRRQVRVRGTKDGIAITVDEGPWERALEELDAHLSRRPDFFRGGRVAVAVGPRRVNARDIEALGNLLQRYGMTLWAVWSESDFTQREAARLGLETGRDDFRGRGDTLSEFESMLTRAKIVYGPIRSGQRVRYEGTVVVLGDVNPGGEVIADGHVVVWGRLQGIAHAGASGRVDAIICALIFDPTQVRIGAYVAQGSAQGAPGIPEVAFVENGEIVVETWETWKRRQA